MQNVKRIGRSALVASMAVAILMLGTGLAQAATGSVGPHKTGTVVCGSPDGVSLTAGAPTVKAVNKTAYTDRQYVAFQPVTFDWNGSAWVEDQRGMVLYGRATDTASPTAWYDWATGARISDPSYSDILESKGYYKVAIKFWWFDNNFKVTGSDYQWSGSYTTPIGAAITAGYCTRT